MTPDDVHQDEVPQEETTIAVDPPGTPEREPLAIDVEYADLEVMPQGDDW